MKNKGILIFAALMLLSCGQKTGRDATDVTRMDRSRLNIGTYHLRPYARTEQHIKDLAECGIDFVVCMEDDRPALDLFRKYGVGAVVSKVCPGWWGGDGVNAGKMAELNPLSGYIEAAAKFEDHPAIWGIDIGDEPSALDFPYYGEVYSKVRELFPNQFPYLNLYPNYASVAKNDGEQTVNQLGTETYAEHISEYCRNVPSDYISYDFYAYSADVPRAYENLRAVADACTWSDRSMWIILQVNSHNPEKWISTNELRFQAYTAMAFGAEVITWACYTAGWWHNQVLDANGEKTQQYDKLKEVNAELHAIGDRYMAYRRISTSFVGFCGTRWLGSANQPSVEAYDDGTFSDLKASDGGPLVVGTMESRDGKGRRSVFVCAADDPYDEHPSSRTVTFRSDGSRTVSVTGTDGRTVRIHPSEGIYSLNLNSNSAVLVESR